MAPPDRSLPQPISSISGLVWPAIPNVAAARKLALLQQLQRTTGFGAFHACSLLAS